MIISYRIHQKQDIRQLGDYLRDGELCRFERLDEAQHAIRELLVDTGINGRRDRHDIEPGQESRKLSNPDLGCVISKLRFTRWG